jgi:hypothetical protein
VSILWVAFAFLFSRRRPLAHTFYVMFPVAFLYAVYWWARASTARWNRTAAASLAAGIVMQAGLALDRAPRLSLYVDRPLVQAAIASRNDRFIGDRRDSVVEVQDRRPRPIDPVPDPEAWLRADPASDLVVTEARWSSLRVARISLYTISIQNTSRTAAYLDLRYTTRYLNADGDQIAAREGIIKEILQPGEQRTWHDLTDGTTPDEAVSAEIAVVAAEKVIPATNARAPA